MPGVNQTPFYAAYVPTSDVQTNYNAMNGHLEKRLQHGLDFSAVYTWSKSMDNASEEGPGFLSNQTDPGESASGVGTVGFRCAAPVQRGGNVDAAHSGEKRTGEERAGQLAGERHLYLAHGLSVDAGDWRAFGGAGEWRVDDCADAADGVRARRQERRQAGWHESAAGTATSSMAGIFRMGGANYFEYGTPGPPGSGRNSFNGPCYMDLDMSVAKQVTFNIARSPALFRFQANFYNIFNLTNLQPIGFGSTEALVSTNPAAGTHVNNPLFGLSPGADSGRVIEFFGRIQF